MFKKKNSFISDDGYVKQNDIVGTVAISLSVIFILLLITLATLALINA